jgi:hypothetical protein
MSSSWHGWRAWAKPKCADFGWGMCVFNGQQDLHPMGMQVVARDL